VHAAREGHREQGHGEDQGGRSDRGDQAPRTPVRRLPRCPPRVAPPAREPAREPESEPEPDPEPGPDPEQEAEHHHRRAEQQQAGRRGEVTVQEIRLNGAGCRGPEGPQVHEQAVADQDEARLQQL